MYHIMHPDNKAHEETALNIRNGIRHYEIDKYQSEFFWAINFVIENRNDCITISTVYLSPKHAIKKKHIIFFQTFSNRFIAVGDYNAKHMHWASKLILLKRREL